MKTISLCVLAVAALIGCGGGVDGDKKLSSLSASEVKDACLELAADFPEKTIMCSAELSITVGVSTAECNDKTAAPATCTATVDDLRACTADLYNRSDAEQCGDTALPASCSAVINC